MGAFSSLILPIGVYTYQEFAKVPIQEQGSKEMYKNESTDVLRVVGLGPIFFLPKEAFIFVISTEKLWKKNNTKPSSPSWMLNRN